jgi:hypothetical protein
MCVNSGFPKALLVCAVALSISSSVLALPVNAAIGPAVPPPVWVTLNASASGNYPGGNELFTVFVVNTQLKPINETVQNMTLRAPFGSNFGPGLPATVSPGLSLLVTIYLQIPANFSKPSFTADLVAYVTVLNGTATTLKVTGSAAVNVFSLTSQTTSSETAPPPTGQSGSISTTLFAAGIAVPSLIVVVLVVLLIRARAGPK